MKCILFSIFVTLFVTQVLSASSGKSDIEQLRKHAKVDLQASDIHLEKNEPEHQTFNVPPEPSPPSSSVPPNATTVAPVTTTIHPNSTTINPNSTTSTPSTTPITSTTQNITTSTPPSSTSPLPPTTPAPSTTTPHGGSSTPTPAPVPGPKPDRKFDGLSFFAGIVLSAGLMAIAVVAFKFYEAHKERNYHTL